jgi:acetoacetyl-CoA synthetase
VATGRVLWSPDPARSGGSRIAGFLRDHGFDDYDSAWAWSVSTATAGDFWKAVADDAGVQWYEPAAAELLRAPGTVAGAKWFPEARLNYAERCLRGPAGGRSGVAVKAVSDSSDDRELTWDDLRDLVSRVRAGLVDAGVSTGDIVAGYLPNGPEALAAMLASASLGAVWTCCAPEMGVAGTLDRLTQCDPVVLIAVDGYRYGGRAVERSAESEAVRAGLPSVRRAVRLPYLDADGTAPPGWMGWADFAGGRAELEFAPVPFDHPLYILYSSGTTGKPKAIVHGHGGILLEHSKALRLHFDIGEGDVFFWFTTTGWMMWNFCVSGLLVDAAVVLFDGDPSGPSGQRLWQIMESSGTTCGGVGAGYLVAGMKAGHRPGSARDLTRLRTLGATGSPLPTAAAEWVYREVGGDLLLASFSGGTDVCTGFVGASPLHPVWAGEISCRCLGAEVEVFDEEGRAVTGVEGELVLTAPLPSMPVGIVGDTDGRRYLSTYFERFPGVWAHGDRATLTERGTVIITGRSDGTLNRGGVRMGTAEFYSVVEGLPEVADSLAVHLEDPEGGPGELMLFVVPAGDSPPDELAASIRAALRREVSPRHVPDLIDVVPAVPRTLSGKKLEVPVKRILAGTAVTDAVAIASVADPASLDPFIELAARRRGGTPSQPSADG